MSMSASEFSSLLRDAIPVIAIVGGLVLVIIMTITQAFVKSRRDREREESRREIAAHVATGALSADDAAKLIAAGKKLKDKDA